MPTGAAATFQLPMGVIHFDPNAATPYVNQMNFTVQHQLTRDTTLQVGYVGTLSRKLSSNIDQNNPVYGPGATSGNVDARRPYMPGTFQSIAEYKTAYNASYNALQVVATQRASHGLSFNANYTYGKGTDLISGDSYNGSLPFTDSTDPARDRGPTDGLAHHIFAFSGTYDAPKLEKLRRDWRLVAGGMAGKRHCHHAQRIAGECDVGRRQQCRRQLQRPSRSDRRSQHRRIQTGEDCRVVQLPRLRCGCPWYLWKHQRNSLLGPGYVNFDISLFKYSPFMKGNRSSSGRKCSTLSTIQTCRIQTPD